MKVFLSWSGNRSKMLANTLREWLPLVLHYLEPWVSQADISAGERWAVTLAKELEVSDFGILCLTRENIGSPWVLFEAGSLAKSLDHGKVIPFLLDLDLSHFSGPLAQFQSKKVDRSDTAELIQDINRICANPVDSTRLTQLFDALWPQFEAQLKKILEIPAESGPTRSTGEVLEDLVATVRSIDQRMRGLEDASANRPPVTGIGGREDFALMLPLLLPEAERQHLRNLASGQTREYLGGHWVRTEVRRLRSLGLVRMHRDRNVGQMQDGLRFDLADFIELTELGKRWLRKLQELEAGEALDDVTGGGAETP
jgi:hypothetical protein